MSDAMQRLLDEAEIRAVHVRYCRGVDRMDWDLIRSCYHPDGYDDHGPFKGGVEDFIAWIADLLPTYISTTHFMGNQFVEIDGNYAWAEHYTRALHRIPATADTPVTDWLLNLRYIDRMEKRAGIWKIAHRSLACDTDRFDPVIGSSELRADWGLGTRDKSDPSYDRSRNKPQPVLLPARGFRSGEEIVKLRSPGFL